MPLRTLAVATALLAGSAGPSRSLPRPPASSPVIELGLTSPLENLDDMERFRLALADRLVWTVRGGERTAEAPDVEIRFTAVRIDRGRVTASYQSDGHAPPEGLSRIAATIGLDAFMVFPDVCLSPDDPPASVRALSNRSHLDASDLEQAIADAARTRNLREAFGFDDQRNLEWGRHVVLVLAASTELTALHVRPLILVLERR